MTIATYDNIPWKTASAINLTATLRGALKLGKIVFDLNSPVNLVPSERASTGSAWLFDSWSLTANISKEDWSKSISGLANLYVKSNQNGESIFRAPFNLQTLLDWYPLRQVWFPSGEPSSLSVALSATLSGQALLGYSDPFVRVSFLAYEITDTAFVRALQQGFMSDARAPGVVPVQSDAMAFQMPQQDSGCPFDDNVRLVHGGRTLRSFQ